MTSPGHEQIRSSDVALVRRFQGGEAGPEVLELLPPLQVRGQLPARWTDFVMKTLSSRRCGESRRHGFSERRFKDVDVLLNGATAYADAGDQLALAGERRSAAH